MKSTTRSTRRLRLAALVVLAASLATWVATGAHRGWTQTSTVTMYHDEVTGIEYPVRHKAFVAGVEFLAAGAALAAVLGGLSIVTRRRSVAL